MPHISEQSLRKVRPRRRLSELNLKTFYHFYHQMFAVFPAADWRSSLYELTLLFSYFLLLTAC
jgi:hypothetical protein